MATKDHKKITTLTLTFFFTLLFFCYPAIGSFLKGENKRDMLNKAYSLHVPFIENNSQGKDDNVSYYAKTLGGIILIKKDGQIVYSFPKYEEGKIVTGWGIKETFIGAFISNVQGEEKAPTKVNYFKGKDPSKWRKNISTYYLVSLGEIYKGIELKLKAYGNNVEKLFYLKPHAHSEIIRIKIEGAKNLEVNEKGELELETGLGGVKFTMPYAYQDEGGKRKPVKVAYTVKGNEYGFKVGEYDRTKELVIDPLLASTFLGGSDGDWDWATSIARDSSGNIYVTGYTRATDFPTTPGAYDTSYNDASDVFISKLDRDLQNLLSSTFLGGNSDEEAYSIAIDSSGNIYIAGRTVSEDLPTTPGAYNTGYNGYEDGFIAKFDSNLETLLASTYLGAGDRVGDSEEVWSVTIGNSGNVFITGFTHSPGFPTTPGAYNETCNDCGYYNTDAFLSKFDSNLSNLLSSTFLGGTDSDYAFSLSFDSNENVYVAGQTTASDFPATPGAYDPTFNNVGEYKSDVFIAKLDSNLQNLLAATFLGGSESDSLGYDFPQQTDKAIALDSSGNVYVTGLTSSLDFPATPGAYSTTREYGGTFVSKLDGNLANLLASTFLCDGVSRSIAIDGNENIFIAGNGDSPDCETSPSAYQPDVNDWGDAYLIKLDSDLQNLLAATFLGGSDRDSALSLAVDTSGNVYVTGRTDSSDFPTVDGSYDTTFNGGDDDAFVAKLDNHLSSETGPCPLEEVYGVQSMETELLRYFRDNVLSKTPEGQEIIRLYYEWSPAIVKVMREDEALREELKAFIDGVLPLIDSQVK